VLPSLPFYRLSRRPNTELDPIDFLYNADISAIPWANNTHRLFFLNKDQVISMMATGSNFSSLPTEYSTLTHIYRLPFPKFAVTSEYDKSMEDQVIHIYFQMNGTHLAELSYRDGRWDTSETLIRIP
jgi:hypothetical protein